MTTPIIAYPDVRFASDHSILVTFGDSITRGIHVRVHSFLLLLSSQSINGVTNLHPAYSSILISFDPRHVKAAHLIEKIQSLLGDDKSAVAQTEPLIELPVCYDEEFGPDIADVASLHGLSPSEVVRIHSSVDYLVYFLGFSPGFPYLGDLPEQLATPRLDTPRTKTPAGSVAIGGSQTGIYPIDSPGGWRIIGRTPRRLFSPENNPPTLLRMGMSVRFVPITKAEYHSILRQEVV
jgi:KipI family sensor histidine kinase inhibitor